MLRNLLNGMEEETKTNVDERYLHTGVEVVLETTLANPSIGFCCNKLNFVGKTELGLQTHVNKKHKQYEA